MAIKKIKLPGMAQPVDIGTTWENISGKPDLMTSSEISAAINAAFATNDAMVFKGTIGAGGTVTQLPATHEAGWTYKVITAGSLAGQPCEIGDMIVCVTDGTVATADDWTVIQTNIDGAVIGPASSTAGHVATFTGTTGKAIQDSGFTIAASVPADAQFTDTTYENKTAVSGGTDVSLVSTGDKYNWNNSVVISDTQPTGNGNKLWVDTNAGSGNSYQVPTVAESLAMGISGAKVGDLVRVNSVDSNGNPTSWKHVPLNEIKCNKNYLINHYMVGGGSQLGDGMFPINQRGQTTYSNNGYGLDMWKKTSDYGSVTIGNNYVELQNTSSSQLRVVQNVVRIPNGSYTLSALITEVVGDVYLRCELVKSPYTIFHYIKASPGLIWYPGTLSHNGAEIMVDFQLTPQSSIKFQDVKLEFGSEQTLCHNEGTEENPVWVLNEIPDYGEELAKCQRYLQTIGTILGGGSTAGNGLAISSDSIRICVNTPVTMRQKSSPKIEFLSGSYNEISLIGNGLLIRPSTCSVLLAHNSITLNFTVDGSITNETYSFKPNNTIMLISCEP